MLKAYYVVVFFMLLAIIFLLIYIVSTVSWIKHKVKNVDKYLDENHYRFIRIFEYTSSINEMTNKIYKLKDSLDAKKNFIEGLEHGEDVKIETSRTEENTHE